MRSLSGSSGKCNGTGGEIDIRKSASVSVSASGSRFPVPVDLSSVALAKEDAARCRSMPLDSNSGRNRLFDNKMPHDVLSSNRSVLAHVKLQERLNSVRVIYAHLI